MTSWICDTNVVSETVRPRPEPNVVRWIEAASTLAIASVTLYELKRGIDRPAAGRRRRFLEGWLDTLLASEWIVVPLDREAALAAAEIESLARRRGRSVEQRDLLILSTAAAHGYGVATRNVEHLRGLGVSVYDPFEDHPFD
jgi:predicted nucleic acid-binding protein